MLPLLGRTFLRFLASTKNLLPHTPGRVAAKRLKGPLQHSHATKCQEHQGRKMMPRWTDELMQKQWLVIILGGHVKISNAVKQNLCRQGRTSDTWWDILMVFGCIWIYCKASHTGDAIRVMCSNVSVGVVHVLCAHRCRAHCDVLFISQLVTILPHIFLSHFCA